MENFRTTEHFNFCIVILHFEIYILNFLRSPLFSITANDSLERITRLASSKTRGFKCELQSCLNRVIAG